MLRVFVQESHKKWAIGLLYRLGFVVLVGVILTGPPAWAETQRSTNDFVDYINKNNKEIAYSDYHPWGVIFGTGWTKESLDQITQWQRDGKWINPFTGQSFPDGTPVFVFGHNNPILEALRVATDHLDIHVLSSWAELKGHHIDFAICHSNGCTNAIGSQREGIMKVETFLALGTDWTSKAFRPGDLKGAELIFFALRGDPIWKLAAPNPTRIGEATPGFKFMVPFDQPEEIVKGVGNLFKHGRSDPDRFPVVRLDPPPGQRGTLLKPFAPHALVDSYFAAISQWMKAKGELQRVLANGIRRREASLREDRIDEDQRKRSTSPSGCPPKCDDGGGGGGGEGPFRGIAGTGQRGSSGGVEIDSTPRKIGQGGSEIKKQVLGARGSAKAPTWGAILPW